MLLIKKDFYKFGCTGTKVSGPKLYKKNCSSKIEKGKMFMRQVFGVRRLNIIRGGMITRQFSSQFFQKTYQQSASASASTRNLKSSNELFNTWRSAFKRFNSSKSSVSGSANANGGAKKKPSGLKALMQEYGYIGLVVYLGIGCIDLPLCYLLVHSQGEDKIREYQDKALSWIGMKPEKKTHNDNTDSETPAANGKEGEEKQEKSSTFWTELALAYAIHKSLIFIRLPITAAITPAVVSKLRAMGVDVSKFTRSAAKSVADQGLKKTLTPSGAKSIGKDMKITPDPTGMSNPNLGKSASKGQRWFF